MFGLFGKRSFIGIDISDHSAKVLKLSRRGKALAHGKIKIKEGVIDNGIIKDKGELIKVIMALLKNTQPKPILRDGQSLKINLNLPESKTFVHVFKFPKELSKEELREAIIKEASETVPVRIENIYWDFIEIEKKESKTVLYFAAFKEVVDSYIEVMEKAGLETIILDIESVSVSRAILSGKKSKLSSMIIDIGAKDSVISVFDEFNVPRMSLDCSVAGSDITKAISQKLKVDYDTAEALKINYGIDNQKPDNKTFPIVKEALQKMVDEAKKTIEYYENNYNSKIGDIFLSGGSSLLLKLDEYLSIQLGSKVVLGDPLRNVKNKEVLAKNKASVFFANIIGIALRGKESTTPEDMSRVEGELIAANQRLGTLAGTVNHLQGEMSALQYLRRMYCMGLRESQEPGWHL